MDIKEEWKDIINIIIYSSVKALSITGTFLNCERNCERKCAC